MIELLEPNYEGIAKVLNEINKLYENTDNKKLVDNVLRGFISTNNEILIDNSELKAKNESQQYKEFIEERKRNRS